MKNRYKATLIALSGNRSYTLIELNAATKIGWTRLSSDVTILSIKGYIDSNYKTRTDDEPLVRWLTVKGQIAVHEFAGDVDDSKRRRLLAEWYRDLKLNRIMRVTAASFIGNVATYIAHEINMISGTALSTITLINVAIWLTCLWRIHHTTKDIINGQ